MRLTTFRKNGQGVSTPVWFAQEGEKLYMMTNSNAGKTKRMRNNVQVTVEPCNARGDVLGVMAKATARELSGEQAQHANEKLNKKYGIQKRMFDLFGKLSGSSRAYFEFVTN
jgi:PPOX class probable F420-dependent enzyme